MKRQSLNSSTNYLQTNCLSETTIETEERYKSRGIRRSSDSLTSSAHFGCEMEPNNAKMFTPDTQISKSNKSENIMVFVRVRPINSQEKSKNAFGVLDCPGNREVFVRERNTGIVSKTFTFDRVFGQHSKQIELYKSVVSPLIEEVLLGYNCTVFAYGQTGTGKTFTMEGERAGDESGSWESDPLAGIVPRAMSQLFDELRVTNSEFTVKVSLVEMYNEEVYDLLSPTEDSKPRTVRLYEDSTKKGSIHIQGLEEVIVHNKHEVYAIMERGSQMRKTASTLLNANSSRSHTVFTVTVHIKEVSSIGDDLMKIGKLHLVDLAGSENIGRSGAVDKRAREAGNINQSLLTLGRVITALVERAPHVPYRESKLTRLLQDSLGGRTKTSIIATVSPASINIEETLSTLDYAHRAKNITNRPEVNQKLTKKAMLKEYTEEIERLRKDLLAAREKNGIFVDRENYERLMSQIESQGQDLTDKIQFTRALEENVQQKESELRYVRGVLEEAKEDLAAANSLIEGYKNNISGLTEKLAKTEDKKEEMEHLVKVHSETESKLAKEANVLLNTASESTVNLDSLFSRLERKKNVEASNYEAGKRFRSQFDEQLKKLADDMKEFREKHAQFSGVQRINLVQFMAEKDNGILEFEQKLKQYTSNMETVMDKARESSRAQNDCNKNMGESMLKEVDVIHKLTQQNWKEFINDTLKVQTAGLRASMNDLVSKIDSMMIVLYKNVESDGIYVAKFTDDRIQSFARQIEDLEQLKNKNDQLQTQLLSKHELQLKENQKFNKTINAEGNKIQEALAMILNLSNNYVENVQQDQNNTLEDYKQFHQSTSLTSKNCLNSLDHDTRLTGHLNRRFQAKIKDTKEQFEPQQKEMQEMIGKQKVDCNLIDQNLEQTINQQSKLLRIKQANLSQLKESCRKEFGSFTNELEINHNRMAKESERYSNEIKNKILEGIEADRKYVEILRSDLFENCDWVFETIEEFKQRLYSQSGQLNEFWESTYLIDLPTGATPQKKAYDFPRNLSATSPHQRILERYRSIRSKFSDEQDNNGDSSAADLPEESSPISSSRSNSSTLSDEDVADKEHTDENKSPVENQNVSASSDDLFKISESSMGPPSLKTTLKGSTRSFTDLSTNKGQGKTSVKKFNSAEVVNKRPEKKTISKVKKALGTPNS